MRVRIGHPGLTAEIWTLGAALQAVEVPDAAGEVSSVVLGCRDEAARLESTAYLGEIVGPFGNRVAGASFVLDGETYHLDPNWVGKHTLHGGAAGFNRQDWTIEARTAEAVTLGLDWTDRAGHHPGPIRVRVTYAVEGSTLTLVTEATTDASTVANVVSHPYFNLSSGASAGVDDHVLRVAAETYLPVDAEAIPLPEAPRVGNAACGVAQLRSVRSSARHRDRPTRAPGVRRHGPGRSGNRGSARSYAARAGVAIETQGFPDAPNRPDFPSTVLRPGEVQRRETRWIFHAG